MRLALIATVSHQGSRVLRRSDDGAHVRRHQVTFPTAVVDLRPAAARFDNALAWLARFRVLKTMSVPVARWTRRLVVHVHQIHRQTFAAGTADQHELICLCVSNGGKDDAQGVRFQTRWNAESSLYNVKTSEGLWIGARGDELGHEQPGRPRCSSGGWRRATVCGAVCRSRGEVLQRRPRIRRHPGHASAAPVAAPDLAVTVRGHRAGTPPGGCRVSVLGRRRVAHPPQGHEPGSQRQSRSARLGRTARDSIVSRPLSGKHGYRPINSAASASAS